MEVEADIQALRLARVPVAPATIYDASGRAVAILDPVTRERRAI